MYETIFFSSFNLCVCIDVVSGTAEHSKAELERMIAEHGGEFVQNAVETTNLILVGDDSTYI
jgi:hypothetical protein